MTESLLAALIWVFAVSAVILAFLTLSALALAIRHERRRRNGVYTAILEMTPSLQISGVLTVSDLINDPSLERQIRRQQDRNRPEPPRSARA
jgi:hypothetical protein